jgi:hypothetical protein
MLVLSSPTMDYVLSFSVWPLLTYTSWVKRVAVASDHTQARIHTSVCLVGLPWTRDQFVSEICTCTTHNSDKRQTSMTPEGFEPEISASKRPQTYVVDRANTGISTNGWLFVASPCNQLPIEITNCCLTTNDEHGMGMSENRTLKGNIWN